MAIKKTTTPAADVVVVEVPAIEISLSSITEAKKLKPILDRVRAEEKEYATVKGCVNGETTAKSLAQIWDEAAFNMRFPGQLTQETDRLPLNRIADRVRMMHSGNNPAPKFLTPCFIVLAPSSIGSAVRYDFRRTRITTPGMIEHDRKKALAVVPVLAVLTPLDWKPV